MYFTIRHIACIHTFSINLTISPSLFACVNQLHTTCDNKINSVVFCTVVYYTYYAYYTGWYLMLCIWVYRYVYVTFVHFQCKHEYFLFFFFEIYNCCVVIWWTMYMCTVFCEKEKKKKKHLNWWKICSKRYALVVLGKKRVIFLFVALFVCLFISVFRYCRFSCCYCSASYSTDCCCCCMFLSFVLFVFLSFHIMILLLLLLLCDYRSCILVCSFACLFVANSTNKHTYI